MNIKTQPLAAQERQFALPLGVEFPLLDLERLLLPSAYKLLPLMRQRYEFELAAAEAKVLSAQEVIERGAYFMAVDGKPTHHYLIAEAAPLQVSPDASETRKTFFEANRFSVAYATHGLFPYRGKFHPQMIKAIINIIGVKPGQVVLDPMVGSGTTIVEAALMGVDAIGIELNPFTLFMSKVKVQALDVDTEPFLLLLQEADKIFLYFEGEEATGRFLEVFLEEPRLKDLATLSYLDALAYARRRKAKKARQLFPNLLKRYLDAVEAFNNVRKTIGLRLGRALVIEGDAKRLLLKDASIDGIVFSPPYSFALDYVENDRIQLEYLGVNIEELKKGMVGLRAETSRADVGEKVRLYYQDMKRVFQECSRVLKPSKYCVVIIGSNTRQTGGIRLENAMVELAAVSRLPQAYHLVREIEGIRNTMLEEHVLFFRKS